MKHPTQPLSLDKAMSNCKNCKKLQKQIEEISKKLIEQKEMTLLYKKKYDNACMTAFNSTKYGKSMPLSSS